MAKMINRFKNNTSTYFTENWLLDNDLKIRVDDNIICINSPSGDVAEQVYERLIMVDKFKDCKLFNAMGYYIRIDKSLQQDIFLYIESISINTLQEGKSY